LKSVEDNQNIGACSSGEHKVETSIHGRHSAEERNRERNRQNSE
jgi:hypothetical protein